MAVRSAPDPTGLASTLRRRLAIARASGVRLLLRLEPRESEVALACLAAMIGGMVGLGVALLQLLVGGLHLLVFDVPHGGHLSAGIGIPHWRILLGTVAGGLLVGLAAWYLGRSGAKEIVDPIEANALFGGRMSLGSSLRLAASTVLSNGFGASVGMEAAYTQTGSGLASSIGRLLGLRRADLRTMVGCGAAAAIAAAFNAPLAGAFYAYELVMGSYVMGTLIPISLAALTGSLVTQWLQGSDPIFTVPPMAAIAPAHYVSFAILGFIAGWLGICSMRAVTWSERLFRKLPGGTRLRPVLGGICVGALALAFPQVLGSGHGAIQLNLETQLGSLTLLLLLVAKVAASALSIGSGFRGGLFSSALFMGALLGALFGSLLAVIYPGGAPGILATTLVGMGATGAAIVGAPLAMVLLVLEVTADFPATMAVLTGVVVATLVVRTCFGYSFSTWRFHLRGVPIRGAHDIGWIRGLTVGRMMRRDFKAAATSMQLQALRKVYPLGSVKTIFLVDEHGGYAGLLDLAAAYAPENLAQEDMTAGELAENPDAFLTTEQNVHTALAKFQASRSERLAVVDQPSSRRLVGYLTEAYALRRYSQDLERSRGEELGEPELYRQS